MNQITLKGEFTLKGKGLHTGLEITARFLPAPENHGYKFKRIDLDDQPVIDALAENVVATNRGTVIAKGDARVSTGLLLSNTPSQHYMQPELTTVSSRSTLPRCLFSTVARFLIARLSPRPV